MTSSVATSGMRAVTLTSWANDPTSSVTATSAAPGPTVTGSSRGENPSRLATST